MTKEEKETKKKAADGKKASKAADKKKAKNALKAAGDKMIMDMAASLPAGEGNSLIKKVAVYDKLNAEKAKLNLAIRGLRAELKGEKIELRVFDFAMKLRKMEPEDQKMFMATFAIYAEQLSMHISPEMKKHLDDLNVKREEARKAMDEVTGGSSGKEIGSSAGSLEASTAGESTGKVSTIVPPRNEALSGAGFKIVSPAVAH